MNTVEDVKIGGSHAAMMRCGVVLGKIIGKICGARAPVYIELVLLDTILNPIETHVHGSGLTLFHGFVGKAYSGGVVNFNWGWWLGMSHFLEAGA